MRKHREERENGMAVERLLTKALDAEEKKEDN